MSLTLINVDLSQAELRTMAVLSGDTWMINALQAGQGDFFDNHLMPIAYPWIKLDYGTVEEFKRQCPVIHKESRVKVKSVQYGLAFGREAPAIAKELKMSTRDAQYIITNYLTTAHSFAQWRQDVMEAAVTPSKRDLLINPFGRKFQSEIITSKNKNNVKREALAFLPQSTSSDICLATAIRINKDLQAYGFHIFNIVHDAIMVEGPEEYAVEVGNYIVQELGYTGKQVMGDTVPFLAEFSIGNSWADLD